MRDWVAVRLGMRRFQRCSLAEGVEVDIKTQVATAVVEVGAVESFWLWPGTCSFQPLVQYPQMAALVAMGRMKQTAVVELAAQFY